MSTAVEKAGLVAAGSVAAWACLSAAPAAVAAVTARRRADEQALREDLAAARELHPAAAAAPPVRSSLSSLFPAPLIATRVGVPRCAAVQTGRATISRWTTWSGTTSQRAAATRP
jgi:hypothetical protein